MMATFRRLARAPMAKVVVLYRRFRNAQPTMRPEQVPEGNGFKFFGAQPAADSLSCTYIYTYGSTNPNQRTLI
jgi:hypothetical protein